MYGKWTLERRPLPPWQGRDGRLQRGRWAGDGGPDQLPRIGLALSSDDGTLYLAAVSGHRVRAVDLTAVDGNNNDPAPTITTLAGTGTAGSSGDGGLATAAQINFHSPAVALSSDDGTLYIAAVLRPQGAGRGSHGGGQQ